MEFSPVDLFDYKNGTHLWFKTLDEAMLFIRLVNALGENYNPSITVYNCPPV
jgi:hypothetical protein